LKGVGIVFALKSWVNERLSGYSNTHQNARGRMLIISFLNPKGGSGKTTLSTNVARAFHERGCKVLLVDSDPQGSASDWHAARDDNPIPLIAYGKPENLKALPGVAAPYDYALVDGAAKLEAMIAAVVKVSDAVLIPVQPSDREAVHFGHLS
jgi:chromosome partitioning protein